MKLLLRASMHRLNISRNRYYTVTDEMIAREIIVSFCIFSLLRSDRILVENLKHDTYGIK